MLFRMSVIWDERYLGLLRYGDRLVGMCYTASILDVRLSLQDSDYTAL